MYKTKLELHRSTERVQLSNNDLTKSRPYKNTVKFAFIGIGDGGSNMACEFAKFGYPTYIFNTNVNDLKKHIDIIPKENCILTPSRLINNKYKGTCGNSDLGYTIASEKKNQLKYAEVLLKPEVIDADFVWITVSLGGGTGTGALPVLARMMRKARLRKQFLSNRVPFGIICSIPSEKEKGSAVRENTLKGLDEIKGLIVKDLIGSILVVDNEKLLRHYEHLVLKEKLDSNCIDALSYGNLATARLLLETAQFPFLSGRQCIDMAKYLNLLSTPGWLTLNKETVGSNCSMESTMQSVFESHPFFAHLPISVSLTQNASLAFLIPSKLKQDYQLQDLLEHLCRIKYGVRNTAFAPVAHVEEMKAFGMRVSIAPPSRIPMIVQELQSWLEDEQSEEWY